MPSSNIAACDYTEALYQNHHGWLRTWLLRRLGCYEHAADIAHDTYVRVLSGPQAEILHKPRAFLTTIAIRLLIDESRRERIERAWREAHAAFIADHAVAPSSEELVEIIDCLEHIARMLDGLDERSKKAFLMFRLDGLSQADIAKELGVSVSMVKKYVAKSLLHCHRALHGKKSGKGI